MGLIRPCLSSLHFFLLLGINQRLSASYPTPQPLVLFDGNGFSSETKNDCVRLLCSSAWLPFPRYYRIRLSSLGRFMLKLVISLQFAFLLNFAMIALLLHTSILTAVSVDWGNRLSSLLRCFRPQYLALLFPQ